MRAEHFDFAVIGGGKGGKTLAAKMATAGRSVAMVEKGMIGGSCINVACIPTKTMFSSAQAAESARHSNEFGTRAPFEGVDMKGVRARKRDVVTEMVARNQANFDRSGMTLIIGAARFTAPRSLEVSLADGGLRAVSADKVFINTGTRPAVPPIPGLAEARPLDSESIQELDRLPEHLIVLGGGYIGCEFAQMFRRFGSRVTIVEQANTFLSREDPDVAEQVLQCFREDGIDVLLEASARRVDGVSGDSVRLTLQTSAGERLLEGSHLLAALGRVPNTEELNLQVAGVETDARRFVKVNDRLETSAEGVWALGDVNGGPQFTHVSLDDWRIVAANLAGGNRSTADRLVPYTLFIDPELGRIGLTETEARSRGLKVKIARLAADRIPRAVTSGEMRGYLKAVVDADTDQLLGASILSAAGGEVMAVIQVAMRAGLRYTTLRDMIFAHPTMAEGLNDLFERLE
ncbi:MAG TPA: mercuric reductase [Gemmatimonadaceae bacterium]|nr:mercuric reductase [Gemmatimonadaceae bacterium]